MSGRWFFGSRSVLPQATLPLTWLQSSRKKSALYSYPYAVSCSVYRDLACKRHLVVTEFIKSGRHLSAVSSERSVPICQMQ